jgi:hypothetical protein
MTKTIAKDTPLAEMTIRKYEHPYDLPERELVRKLCLSIGLLQPGDSRDIVVDVLYVMLKAGKDKKPLSSEEITAAVIEYRKQNNIQLKGVASSNIRRQLKRLRELFLIEKVKNDYRIVEFSSIVEAFEEKVEKYLLPSIMGRVKEYYQKVEATFNPKA